MARSPAVTTGDKGAAAAAVAAGDESPTFGGRDALERRDSNDAMTIEDLQLPKTLIARLARGVLPQGTQIQANAVTALGKSATVFVNYLTTQ
jgi:DNA polymerase epsilon subunit 3